MVAFPTSAPPAFALTTPVIPSAMMTEINVTGMRSPVGGKRMAINGITAPMRNESAEAKASFSVNSFATDKAVFFESPFYS